MPTAAPPMLQAFTGPVRGLVRMGNIDLRTRPRVLNPDGSFSTVKSMSIGVGGHEVLIPQVIKVDGAWVVADPRTAIEHYRKTGEHLGVFESVAAANAYADALHHQQGAMFAHGR